jgi:DNA-binding response OmpR family regulator
MVKILIVNDDFVQAKILRDLLSDAGYDVCGVAATIADAIELGKRHHPNMGIVNINLSNGELGEDFVFTMREYFISSAGWIIGHPHAFGVLYSADSLEDSRLIGAKGEFCISKPFDIATVSAALKAVGNRMMNLPVSLPLPDGGRMSGRLTLAIRRTGRCVH